MTGCLLLSLGQLLPTTEDASALLLPYLSAGQPPLVRFCAVMALSFLLQEAVPEEVVRVFFTVLTDPASVQAAYNELPSTWAGRSPHFHAFEFLGWLTSSRHHDLIMEQLVRCFLRWMRSWWVRSPISRCAVHSTGSCSIPHHRWRVRI